MDELDGFFQTRLWGKENVNVIGHNYKLMRQICGAVIVAKAVDELLGLTAFPQRLKSRSSFFLLSFSFLPLTARLKGAFSKLLAKHQREASRAHPCHSSIIFTKFLNK